MTTPRKVRPIYDRWADKVDFDGPNGCWVWTELMRRAA